MSCPECEDTGEVEVGTRQDSFGNWDTETFRCPLCEHYEMQDEYNAEEIRRLGVML